MQTELVYDLQNIEVLYYSATVEPEFSELSVAVKVAEHAYILFFEGASIISNASHLLPIGQLSRLDLSPGVYQISRAAGKGQAQQTTIAASNQSSHTYFITGPNMTLYLIADKMTVSGRFAVDRLTGMHYINSVKQKNA